MNTKFAKTHARIIDRGIRLLYSQAFDKVSIKNICEEAGISRPTFYLHFRSKEHLVAEYYGTAYFFSEKMKQWITSLEDPWTAIIRMQILYIQNTCNTDHVVLIGRYLSYQLTVDSQNNITDLHNSFEDTLITLIRKAQKSQIILNASDAHYLSKAVFMLHTGNLFNWCAKGGRFDRYTDFFWTLEAILSVCESHRGLWKLEENYILTALSQDRTA